MNKQIKTNLHKFADVALRRARESLMTTGSGGLTLMLGFEDGRVEPIPVPDSIAQLLGFGWGKDVLFGAMRAFGKQRNADAVVYSTEAWLGVPTEEGKKLRPEEWSALMREYDTEGLQKRGLIERVEVLMVNAQDAENVVVITQRFRRDASGRVYAFDDPETIESPQDCFEGRGKMFGDLSEDKLHEHRTWLRRRTEGAQ